MANFAAGLCIKLYLRLGKFQKIPSSENSKEISKVNFKRNYYIAEILKILLNWWNKLWKIFNLINWKIITQIQRPAKFRTIRTECFFGKVFDMLNPNLTSEQTHYVRFLISFIKSAKKRFFYIWDYITSIENYFSEMSCFFQSNVLNLQNFFKLEKIFIRPREIVCLIYWILRTFDIRKSKSHIRVKIPQVYPPKIQFLYY